MAKQIPARSRLSKPRAYPTVYPSFVPPGGIASAPPMTGGVGKGFLLDYSYSFIVGIRINDFVFRASLSGLRYHEEGRTVPSFAPADTKKPARRQRGLLKGKISTGDEILQAEIPEPELKAWSGK